MQPGRPPAVITLSRENQRLSITDTFPMLHRWPNAAVGFGRLCHRRFRVFFAKA